MAKLESLIEKPFSGEWGLDDENGIGIPVLRTTNFTNEGVINYEKIVTRIISSSKLKDKFLRYGDIILEKSGGSEKQPVGRVVFFEGENDRYLFNNFTTVLRVQDNRVINSKYLFYVLFYNYFSGGTKKFQSKTTGLHNLHLTNFIKSVDIPLVSLSQQVKIVKKFDTINSIIAKRKLQLSKLDQLVKARFVEMFGDPMINPLGLPIVRLASTLIVEPQNGLYKPQSDYVDDSSGTPILRIDSFYNGKLCNVENLKRLICTEQEKQKYLLNENDIVINRVNSIEYLGKCGHIKNLNEDTVFESNMMRFHMDEKKFDAVYATTLLSSKFVYRQILNRAKKAVNQASINQEDVRSFEIYMPPLEKQKEFAAFVQNVDKSKTVVKQSLEKLETLKKSLMQEYFG